MIRYPVQKIFGLTVLYAIIIFGIFILQFRSETAVSLSFGKLKISLAESQDADGKGSVLKNTFLLTFQGIALTANDADPVYLIRQDGSRTPLVLTSWQKRGDAGCDLIYSDGVAMSFTASGDNLSAAVTLPPDTSSLTLPFKPVGDYAVTQGPENQILFSQKDSHFALTGIRLDQNRLLFTPEASVAQYASYTPVKQTLTFEDAAELSPIGESAYTDMITRLEQIIIRAVTAGTANLTTDQNVATAIAVMAKNGHYAQGIEAIPTSFKNDSRRTYLSSPFLGSIRETYASLSMADANMASMIQTSISNGDLNIFTIRTLVPYLLRQPWNNPAVTQVLEIPAGKQVFDPSPIQAAGLLSTYSALAKGSPSLAEYIEPYMEASLDSIQKICTAADGRIILENGSGQLPLIEAVSLAYSLIMYGKQTGMTYIEESGYAIINSYLPAVSNLDFNSSVAVYNVLVYDNPYMPRFQIVRNVQGETPIWAWSCAESIQYTKHDNGNITIAVNFLSNQAHYIIFGGIAPFRRIQMYNMNYRSDPQFETYNASGYVYDANSSILYLKSKHRTGTENIELIYSIQSNQQPAALN